MLDEVKIEELERGIKTPRAPVVRLTITQKDEPKDNQESVGRQARAKSNGFRMRDMTPVDPEANRERDSSLWGTLLYGAGASLVASVPGAVGLYFAGALASIAFDECANADHQGACFASEFAGLGAAAGCILGASIGGFFGGRKAHREERGGFCEGIQAAKKYFGFC